MGLAPQTRVGSYEILAPIGTGGMGEVYRARDTRLGREVALKVLSAAYADDAERMARFQREAHLLASLNHPGIATLHGLEEAYSLRALVMELVPGPTLAERIAQGALPQEEALEVARQIAEAFEYAHERGIVHRDLKPANVKLTPDGAVKVLDFGLAKAILDDPAATDVSQSPTLSAVATRAGIILGTAAYMSPEQARGKPADRRSDIWSFGVVLYEMLSGKRMFSGETAAETLASVLKTEPDWGALPAGTPASVRRFLRGCLEKDARRRVQAIGDARIVIEDVLAGVPEETLAAPAFVWRRAIPWLVATALLAFLLGLWSTRSPPVQPEKLQRLSVELGTDASLVTDLGAAAVISPDGSVLALIARKAAGEASQLYVRRLDQLEAAPLAGTEGAHNPFFSPDGASIAFFAGGKLKKVAATGGATVTLCDAAADRGGTWGEDGSILFTGTFSSQEGLWRVSSAGGAAEVLATPDHAAGEWYSSPQALPGGEAVLFTARPAAANLEAANRVANLVVQRLPGGPRKIVHRGGYEGRYLPSGHLVYMHEGTLFAALFDLDRLETTGPPSPALEGVSWGAGAAQFAFSRRGTLVFVPGVGGAGMAPIQWMDAQGNLTPLRAVAADYRTVRFSPDGRRLAIGIREGRQWDVWVYEWERDTLSRLTFDASEAADPVWTPNGQRIAFASTRADKATLNLYWQRADGTGEAERLTESPNSQTPASWHPSGKFLAFNERHPQTAFDIMILPLEGDEASGWKPGKPRVFLSTPFLEGLAAFSPDGRWVAYQSNESGTFEVYVRPFPGPGGKWQVSTGGGRAPVWSRYGKELFYWSGDRIWVASYAVRGDSFRAENPRVWSPGRVPWRVGAARFDPHPDGKRFAVVKAPEESEIRRDKVVLITNFFDELRRIAPARKR